MLVKPPWQVLLLPAAAGVVEDGYRWVKEIVQPEVAIRTARHDDISNYSWRFCWRPEWYAALAAIG